VEVQCADGYGYDIQCQVVCEKGTVNLPDPYTVVMRRNASETMPILTDWSVRFIEAYDIELNDWIDSLTKTGQPQGPSSWDGYAACVAADALNKSRGTGQFLPVQMIEKPSIY
jgi:myo-inositol 2-dehydrogenase/D-chiro-inositol 1-dehydrogenase